MLGADLRRLLALLLGDRGLALVTAELRESLVELDIRTAWHRAGHPPWHIAWLPGKQETPEVVASEVSTNRNSVLAESGGRYGKSEG